TLVEGFAYAITPIAAFVMVLGSKGLLLVGKYLQMLIWVQLWLPIMSVINLFIYIMGQQALAKYTTGNLSSFEGVAYAGAEIERWIGIGGMMAAATPVLSLMLVTGSVYAFNSLAQRVGASDTVNEKLMSPDLVDR
ncbi:TPA: conjugal transfer protein TraG, partial [Salmonella enterica]|nr:conjugal transfer protein TraG [Salmonella enterica]